MVLKPCRSWDIYHINWLDGFLNHQQYHYFFWIVNHKHNHHWLSICPHGEFPGGEAKHSRVSWDCLGHKTYWTRERTPFPTIIEVENGLETNLVFQGPILHFHAYGRESNQKSILILPVLPNSMAYTFWKLQWDFSLGFYTLSPIVKLNMRVSNSSFNYSHFPIPWLSRWWLNQPIWKICLSKWIIR